MGRHAGRDHDLRRHQFGRRAGHRQGAEEKKRVYFNNGAGTSALTNEQCSPYTVHYAYDTVALAKGTGAGGGQRGGKSWFFLTADYAFGQALQDDTTRWCWPRAARWWARSSIR